MSVDVSVSFSVLHLWSTLWLCLKACEAVDNGGWGGGREGEKEEGEKLCWPRCWLQRNTQRNAHQWQPHHRVQKWNVPGAQQVISHNLPEHNLLFCTCQSLIYRLSEHVYAAGGVCSRLVFYCLSPFSVFLFHSFHLSIFLFLVCKWAVAVPVWKSQSSLIVRLFSG